MHYPSSKISQQLISFQMEHKTMKMAEKYLAVFCNQSISFGACKMTRKILICHCFSFCHFFCHGSKMKKRSLTHLRFFFDRENKMMKTIPRHHRCCHLIQHSFQMVHKRKKKSPGHRYFSSQMGHRMKKSCSTYHLLFSLVDHKKKQMSPKHLLNCSVQRRNLKMISKSHHHF